MFLPSNITLKFGDSGDFVSELQRRLSAVHCFSADAINGFFDGATVNGVSQFQSMSAIRSDGIAGPETLRRLNGAISGDTSSSADHKAEEEERVRKEALLQQIHQQELLAQQQAQPTQYVDPSYGIASPIAQQELIQQPQQPEINYVQHAAYVPQHTIAQAPSTVDTLAQMLLTPQQSSTASSVSQAATVVPVDYLAQAQPSAVQIITPQQAAVVTSRQQAEALHQQHTIQVQPQTQPIATAASTLPVTAAPEAAPKGIIGRAVQYANDMVQKLATYFEAKLPTHVIDEVKDIGLTMSKNGVKEAIIPAGPEQHRSVDAPARGPQQQAQVPQRS
jgi:peptidoglycan hydrolase-like protein with peptidoglycan-binding domain